MAYDSVFVYGLLGHSDPIDYSLSRLDSTNYVRNRFLIISSRLRASETLFLKWPHAPS